MQQFTVLATSLIECFTVLAIKHIRSWTVKAKPSKKESSNLRILLGNFINL